MSAFHPQLFLGRTVRRFLLGGGSEEAKDVEGAEGAEENMEAEGAEENMDAEGAEENMDAEEAEENMDAEEAEEAGRSKESSPIMRRHIGDSDPTTARGLRIGLDVGVPNVNGLATAAAGLLDEKSSGLPDREGRGLRCSCCSCCFTDSMRSSSQASPTASVVAFTVLRASCSSAGMEGVAILSLRLKKCGWPNLSLSLPGRFAREICQGGS
jgi:hypothetical protein